MFSVKFSRRLTPFADIIKSAVPSFAIKHPRCTPDHFWDRNGHRTAYAGKDETGKTEQAATSLFTEDVVLCCTAA
jgi:hypothetical protein